MKVYLIRHAESEENVLSLKQKTTITDFNDMLQGSPSTPLTRWGYFQAQKMVGKLDGSNIAHIYTSPFDRAIQTATIIGNEFGITPQIDDDLREILPHQLKRLRNSPNQARLGKLLVRSYMKMVMPGGDGEKFHHSLRRSRRVWKRLTGARDQSIALVSHYGLISLLLFHLRYKPTWHVLTEDISNGGVSVVVRRA